MPQVYAYLAFTTIMACIGNFFFLLLPSEDYGYNFYYRDYDFPSDVGLFFEITVFCLWAGAAASVFHLAKSGKLAKWVEEDHNRGIAAAASTDDEPIVVVIL